MKSFRSIDGWRGFRAGLSGDIGFVPTLGGLHEGHASLIRRARKENEAAVVSVFLNPTQFDQPKDLAGYPAVLDADLAMLEQLGVDAVLMPPAEAVYADGFRFKVEETAFSRELCGAHRPGHFSGVLTVVMKLLNLVRPRCAYFGEKDHQQLNLIRDMAAAFFMDVSIVPCPIVRAADGLALSSRNALLDAEGRRLAPKLHELLRSPGSDAEVAESLAKIGFRVDYVTTRQGRRLAAAALSCDGRMVRLIDNVRIDEGRTAAGAAPPGERAASGQQRTTP